MLSLETLGMQEVLPAFVVGFDVSTATEAVRLHGEPEWLLEIRQQAGGHCMSYPVVVGAVLRVEANLDRGSNEPAELVRGLRAMAEDPQLGILARDFPILRKLVYTRGGTYSGEQLLTLHTLVSRYFRVPRFDEGIEAFVRCSEADLLEHFAGWRIFSCRFRDGAETTTELDYVALASRRPDLILGDGHVFGPSILQELSRTARALGVTSEPRVFLLWENSD